MATVYYADKEIINQMKAAMTNEEFIEETDNSVYPPVKRVIIPAWWYVQMGITLKKKEGA